MATNKHYVAIGEETNRGTKQATTVSFLPLLSPAKPKFEPRDEPRKQARGEQSSLGATAMRRHQRAWSGSLDIEAYSEGGTVKGGIGTVVKHFCGKANSGQNGATGQYYHMSYPVADPFAAANLGAKALTLNQNMNEGDVMKNWPWVGGRCKGLSFVQEPGQPLKITPDFFGQFREAVTAEIGSPAFPAENLRFDWVHCRLYTGTITRTGTGPDYTQFAFGSATQIKPDKLTIKLENGQADKFRLAGVNYADKTRIEKAVRASVEFTVDWEDPASGFSSIDDFALWFSDITSYINFCAVWDTGVPAGSGDNHMLIIDLPVMYRKGGDQDFDPEKDPLVTLQYEALLDLTTTKYPFGIMLKNTAASV